MSRVHPEASYSTLLSDSDEIQNGSKVEEEQRVDEEIGYVGQTASLPSSISQLSDSILQYLNLITLDLSEKQDQIAYKHSDYLLWLKVLYIRFVCLSVSLSLSLCLSLSTSVSLCVSLYVFFPCFFLCFFYLPSFSLCVFNFLLYIYAELFLAYSFSSLASIF